MEANRKEESQQLVEALHSLEERLTKEIKGKAPDDGAILRKIFADLHSAADTAAVADSKTDEENAGSLPPGLHVVGASLQTTPSLPGAEVDDEVVAPPPGLEPLGDLDSTMPKKIPMNGRPFDNLRAYQTGVPTIPGAPMAITIPKKAAPLKKFCVFCGMQVDPEYISAKFCAFCGAEHASLGNMNNADSIESQSTSPNSPQSSFDDYYNELAPVAWPGTDYYSASAALAWTGLGTSTWDGSENSEEFDMYGQAYPLTSPSWPPQGMAW